MTSYNLSMFDTPRQPKAPEAKYDLSMLDQGQPKTIWQPLQPEQVQAATTIASFGDATKSASMDKLRSELRQYLGDDAPMVGSLNFEDAQRQLQRAQMDHILRDSPHTARWFTEQVQQGKTPYDVGTLANIERVTRVAPLLPYAAARGAYNTLGGLTAAPGGFADVVGQALEPVFGKLPKSELTSIGNFITEYGRKATGSVPDNLTIGEKGLVAGVESLGANLTTFGMAPFGLQVTLATMATSVGGSTYLENLKATGNSATALLHGILDAGYEYIFEKMGGTGVLFDKAAWAKAFLGGVAKFAAREIPTELATTVAQKADQYILQNPERTFEQFMAEIPEDLAVTAIATLVGGGGQVAIFKGVEALANMGNTTAKAQTAHDNLTALLDNVAKSELYLNDPDTFAQFFQGVAGDATVTVDPVKLVEAMTAANVSEEALPSLKDQLNAPGEIELTVQELATAFAGTGAETTLLQHVRPEPDLPTLAESKEQTKTAFEAFQAAGEKALARFQADEVFNENLKAVKEEVVADILHTGRAGKHYAEGYGTLMAHFYATMAKAHGVTPLQIRDGWTDANGVEHRGYNPRVVGPTGQVRGRTPATTVDFKRGRVANLMNRDNWAVLEAGNPNGTEATPEENAASMAKLKAYLDKEGIEYHDAKGSYFGTKADSLMLLGVTAERASEIGNMFGQESIATRHGLVFGDGTVAQATGIKEVRDTEAEDHTFLPAFGSAFRLEIPDASFENKVKLDEVLNQSVSTRTPTQKAGRPDPHLTTGLDVDYSVVEQDADLVGRLAAVVKTYPGIKKGLRNPNKIVEAFIKHVEGNLSWLYDNVPPEIRERSKLWYDGGRRIIERWVDKYGFTDAQIAGVIAVLSPQTEWDMNVTRAERILDIWTQRQDFAWSDEMNAEADAIDSIKPVLREAIRGKKLSELDSDLLRGVWIRVYDQAHNPRVVRGITPEGGFTEFKKTKGGKEKMSTWGSFADIGKAVRILRDGSIPNISRSLGSEHKVRNFYNNLFDPSDSRSVTIDTHAVAAGLLRPLAGGSIEVTDNLGARPRHDSTGTNGTYVLYAEAHRRVAMAKGVLPRELQSITWEAVRRLFPDNYKSDATRAQIDALWKPNETGKESADEIRNKILEDRGGTIPNPAWERSGTGLDVGQPSSTYQSGVLERSWADGTPGTRAGGYFAQTVPATGKPAGLTITGVHFSPTELTNLLPSKYGKGLEGAERARVMASKDARITRRTHFYVNTGQGVFPEAGTGGKAHVSELANLYDADVDALGLFKGKTDEQLNAAESAVLDAGYSGYVMRGFGNQGAAVVFGARVGDTIPTKFVGGKEEASVPVAPAAQYSETQRLRRALTTSKDLPHGAMTAAKWREHIGRVLPDLLPKIEASGAFERVQGAVYRDELARAIEPPDGQFYQTADQTETPEFKRWSKGHPIVPLWETHDRYFESGEPVVVGALHGTTGDFTEFDLARANPESDMGAGFYFTNNDADANANYAGEGPDLTQKIEMVAERIRDEFDTDGVEATEGEVYAAARERLGVENDGLLMPVWVRFDNPFVLGGTGETFLTYGQAYDEEADEYGEETGLLVDFIDSLRDVASEYFEGDVEGLIEGLVENALDADGVSASTLFDQIINSEEFGYISDDEGHLVAREIVRKTLAALGYDGIIDHTVNDKFGTGKKKGLAMAGVGRSTSHFIAFEPTQIKSATGNQGTFDLNDPNILRQSGWYSPLTRAFQNTKQAAMPAAQWASWLTSNKAKLGLKDDEIQWSGLNEYLELRGKDKITKAEIVDYLNGNGVRVEDTVKGRRTSTFKNMPTDDKNTVRGILQKYDYLGFDTATEALRAYGENPNAWDMEDEDKAVVNSILGADAGLSPAKFAGYWEDSYKGGIPGTYREILVTLPEREAAKLDDDGQISFTPEKNNAANFRSGHWDEPNVLVHVRLDEVNGADGKRYVRVGEVQSDWGQKGKKVGFGKEENKYATMNFTVEPQNLRETEWKVSWADGTFLGGYGSMRAAQQAAVDAQSRGGRDRIPSAPFVTDTKAWVALGIKRAIMHALDVGADGVVFGTGEQNANLYDLSKQVDRLDIEPYGIESGVQQYRVTAMKDGARAIDRTVAEPELPNVVGKDIAKEAIAGKTRFEGEGLRVGGEGMRAFYDQIVPQVANDVLKKIGGGKVVFVAIAQEGTAAAKRENSIRRKTGEPLVDEKTVSQPGFPITPTMREAVASGVPLFQGKPAYTVRSPDGKYQGIRELTDAEARELIDLGYQINRVAPGYGQKQNAIGGFNPNTMEITLLAQSNLSTFLHETGHFFLTAYADMAAQEGAPQQVVDDMNAILKWFGIEANPGGMPGEGAVEGSFAQAVDQTSTPEFKRWFDDSKVVDAEGKPLVVYHGTSADFDTFRLRVGDIGMHFGTLGQAEDRVAYIREWKLEQEGNPSVMPVYLHIRNPLRLTDAGSWKADNLDYQLRELFPGDVARIRKLKSTKDIREFLQGKGYDGVVYKNTGEVAGSEPYRIKVNEARAAMDKVFPKGKSSFSLEDQKVPEYQAWSQAQKEYSEYREAAAEDSYIAFSPAQIKSAIGNQGTFDPTNPNILRQGGAPGTRGPLPYGRTPLEVWNAMSVDQQRPYHEQFAESFEQYLFSGKAPTRELQSLFQRFAKWLTRVYGSIKEFIAGHPGAKVDPEMAAVMDRMLATETEIAAAEDNRNYEALFRTAAEAGMTPAQFAAYLDLPEEARAVAEEQLRTRSLRDMKWLQNRKNKTVAALQKEAAAVRAEVRKEVAETVAQEPIFRALRWLKRGELTNPDTGEEVKVTAGNKLSIPALEGMYPEGALGDKPNWRSLGYGQYGMLANKGLHPDVVADMFGFDSGAALVDALVNAPKFKDEVEGRTDQIMLERHGDLSSPDKIAQAADEAIHNEVRTKIVATELSFLDKLTGSPSFLIKAAKEYARQLVANRTSKTLKAWVFAADEVRASKAAAAALKKGDTKAAANHKRVELLNHAAVREAHAAEKELKKIVDRLRKIASYKDDDSSAKARDMDMVNAVRVVLYRFGLGTERKGKAATEYLSLVETNDPAMGAALRDLVDSTTDNAKDWRDLKLSELRDLHDAVEAVWTLAKRSRQMEVDGKLVPRRQIEQELYDRLDEIGIPDTMPGETSAVTESERNWMKFSTFVAALRRVESWVEAKDGKAMGPFRKYIWSQIKDAAGTYRVKKAEYLKAYRELLDTIAPTLKRELIDAREIGYTFGKGEGGMGMVELLHAILHTGNASNKRKLLLGRGWATDNGDGTMDTSKWDAFVARMIQEGKLTKAHYDFAQGVWDLLDSTKIDAQKAHRSVFGRYFAEVTADAFTTPFGDYRGGYVPAQADPEIVQDAQLKELANQENENMVYAFPSTPRGFTKSRVEYNRPLRLDLRSLAGHIDKVLLFSYLTEPVSDVRRVILSKTVSQALGRVDPKAIGGMLTPWLNRVAKQIVEDRVPGREPLARFWSVARARAGMSAMFANLANSVQQITGISLAAVKVRPKYLLEAMAHGTMSPRKLAAHVAAMSPYMRDRMHNDVVLMGEAIDEILLNPGVYESAKAWSAKHAYFMQRAVDNYLSPMIWMGAFNQAKENGSDDLEARRLADSAVRETQGSQAPEDIAAFEQGTAFYRMFVQFAGYFNMNANLLGTEFVKISRDMGLKKGAGRGLYVLALGFYVPAVLGELIIQAFRGGPDDDDKDGEYLDDWLAAVFGYGPARYLTAMAPVVGQAANALFNTLNNKPYDDRISTAPAISMIESAVKAPISVYKAIADEGKSAKAVNDTATLISMTVGVPARAVAKPISYLTGVANEEIAPEDTYDAIRGTITGTASTGSKQ